MPGCTLLESINLVNVFIQNDSNKVIDLKHVRYPRIPRYLKIYPKL